VAGGREKDEAFVHARADEAVIVDAFGPRRRLLYGPATRSIVVEPMQRLVRLSRVDDATVFGARDVVHGQQVA
jgi:hypothetical protein